MQINLIERNICGTIRYFPTCEKAELFASFFKSTKTIPLWAFTIIRRLGYKIVIKQEISGKFQEYYPIGTKEEID